MPWPMPSEQGWSSHEALRSVAGLHRGVVGVGGVLVVGGATVNAVVVRWLPVASAVALVWVGYVVALHWFGVIARDQRQRERRLDRREASLQLWADELEVLDRGRAEHERVAGVLLDRALGPEPVTAEGGPGARCIV